MCVPACVATGERTDTSPATHYSYLEGSYQNTDEDGYSNASPVRQLVQNDSEVDLIEIDCPRCLDSGSESSSSCLPLSLNLRL